MSFTVGLDIGQSQDPTALAAIQQAGAGYHLRHIDRFELGTKYPAVADEVARLMKTDQLDGAELVVDATGVGRPIVEMLEDRDLRPFSIWITGGDSVSKSGREFRVPKRELASCVQALLQDGRLKFARDLPLANVLREELQKFRAKIDVSSGNASFEHWRERDTDDVVLALACACWKADRATAGSAGGFVKQRKESSSSPSTAGHGLGFSDSDQDHPGVRQR